MQHVHSQLEPTPQQARRIHWWMIAVQVSIALVAGSWAFYPVLLWFTVPALVLSIGALMWIALTL